MAASLEASRREAPSTMSDYQDVSSSASSYYRYSYATPTPALPRTAEAVMASEHNEPPHQLGDIRSASTPPERLFHHAEEEGEGGLRDPDLTRTPPTDRLCTPTSSPIALRTPGSRINVPRRTTSLRSRKPVPPYLPMPNSTLPASHPFAKTFPAEDDSPLSPGSMKEKDLFYDPPVARGPVPPKRRSVMEMLHGRSSSTSSAGLEEVPIDAATQGPGENGRLIHREETRPKHRASSTVSLHQTLPLSSQMTVSHSAPQFGKNPAALDGPLPPLPGSQSLFDLVQPSISGLYPSLPTSTSIPSFKAVSSEAIAEEQGHVPDAGFMSTPTGEKADRPHLNRNQSLARTASRPSAAASQNALANGFSVDGLPELASLLDAATCFLRDEEGQLVCFGDFLPGIPRRTTSPDSPNHSSTRMPGGEGAGSSPKYEAPVMKTVIFFIRHFWCGQCQDYTMASISQLDPAAIAKAGVRVVIISNGSWKIIKAYRRVLNCPFPIYVDAPRNLYGLFGMTRLTNDFGPLFKGRAAYHQRPVPTQLLHGLGNAFFRFPLASPGLLTQLGGEFILGAGHTCEYAHRMTTTSDHMEAPHVLRLAGVAAPTREEVMEIQLADSQRAELARLEEEMRVWREGRQAELDRIRRRKAARRGIEYRPNQLMDVYGIDVELGEALDHNVLDDDLLFGRKGDEGVACMTPAIAAKYQGNDEHFDEITDIEERKEDRAGTDADPRSRSRGLDVELVQ